MVTYRFIYFNVRGAGELCRLTLAASGAIWEDVRYPMTIAGRGFSYGFEFRRDLTLGGFRVNMGHLPILQLVEYPRQEEDNSTLPPSHAAITQNEPRAIATIGQSHSIAKFVAKQHGLMGSHALEEARVDTIYECCRDIKTAWYRAKRSREGKQSWFRSIDTTSVNTGNDGDTFHNPSLSSYCRLLEEAIAANQVGSLSSFTCSPWCLQTPGPTLADLALYHLLGTPMNAMSGATESFFDGERDSVVQGYQSDCPRIVTSLQATASLPAIRAWEQKRPDTFS